MSADDLTNRTPKPDDNDTDPASAEANDENEDNLQHEREQQSAEMAALETDAPSASDQEDESAPVKPATPPAPDAAPRVVSEAPFGGVVSSGPTSPPAKPDSDAPDTEPPIQPTDEAVAAIPSDTEAAALNDLVQRKMNADSDEQGDQSEGAPDMPEKIAPGIYVDDLARPGGEDHIDAQDTALPADDSDESKAKPVSSVRNTDAVQEPITTPPSTDEPDRVSEADAWDDSISPELAAVLFKPSAPAEEPAPAESITTAHETVVQPPADASAEAAPVSSAKATVAPPTTDRATAEPIQLTNTAQARTLPITAEGRNAPAPNAPLAAKVRYVRVEEPIKDDNGQRIEESWTYFKTNFPGLEGRLVRKASCEELQYADGSWEWTYERRYDDGGRDRREVRANADHTYIERKDEVSVLDGETGKRLQYEEDAALILAAPEREEKRGILGGLFGRDKDDDESPAARIWREASSSESRQARKEGGNAFDRGFLGGIFS